MNNGEVQRGANCDFPYFGYAQQLSTREECSVICIEDSKCTHFVWTDPTCQLKFAPLGAGILGAQGFTCGYIPKRVDTFHW